MGRHDHLGETMEKYPSKVPLWHLTILQSSVQILVEIACPVVAMTAGSDSLEMENVDRSM